MEQGQIERNIIKQCMRTGAPLPAKIQNAPSLGYGLQLYYVAFEELSSCRPMGMSLGPIPWTAMLQYAQVHEFSLEQFEDLVYFISSMDLEYIKWRESKVNVGRVPEKVPDNR